MGFMWKACIHKCNNNYYNMEKWVIQLDGEILLFFCGVFMSLVACCLSYALKLHCRPGNTWLPNKSTQSEQVCANALQSKVWIPSVLRFLHILSILLIL